jgi:hypothetical protein
MEEIVGFIEKMTAEYSGKTVKSVTLLPLNMDGNGPCMLSVRFTDDSGFHCAVDQIRGEANGISWEWASTEIAKIRQMVLEDSQL